MLKLEIENAGSPLETVLCLAAHCDDIEIGCGGTILKLREHYPNVQIYWVVFCSTEARRRETVLSAQHFLNTTKNLIIESFRDCFLPYLGVDVKEKFESLKADLQPDLIFTHYRHDIHQDHRFVSELTWNTFRNHLIFEYEIPKYEGNLGTPNFYVPLSESHVEQKINTILEAYISQQNKKWFHEDVLRGLASIRGLESGNTSRYAEAFYARKMCLGI